MEELLKSSTTNNSRSTSSLEQLQCKLYLKSSTTSTQALPQSPAQTIEYNCKIQRSLLPPASSTNQDKGNQPLRIFLFGSEFNRCLIASLKCVHLKKTKSNVISAETKQTLLPKQTICNNQMSSYAVMPNR